MNTHQTNPQWQFYKSLELIPDAVSELQVHPWGIKQITHLWRSMQDSMSGKQAYTLQVEHLERCLELELKTKNSALSNLWQRCHKFLDQSLSLLEDSTRVEPEVWQSVDASGQHWWHVYHPRTGEQVDLASEDEVCTWIEQSFYR